MHGGRFEEIPHHERPDRLREPGPNGSYLVAVLLFGDNSSPFYHTSVELSGQEPEYLKGELAVSQLLQNLLRRDGNGLGARLGRAVRVPRVCEYGQIRDCLLAQDECIDRVDLFYRRIGGAYYLPTQKSFGSAVEHQLELPRLHAGDHTVLAPGIDSGTDCVESFPAGLLIRQV